MHKLIRQLQEEDLFPNASEEDIKRREIELERSYPSMNIFNLIDVLSTKARERQEALNIFDYPGRSEEVTRGLMKYKNLSRKAAVAIQHRYLNNEPIENDPLFNEVFRALNGDEGGQ